MVDTPSTPVPVLTEKTRIRLPLSVVASALVPLLGAAAWATKVYVTIAETHDAVVEMKAEMKDWRGSIEQRLRALEGAASARPGPTASRSTTDRINP